MKNGSNQRDAKWTESIAVGDKEFVMETKAKLGAKAIGRRELENNEGYELKEPQSPYTPVFTLKKCTLSLIWGSPIKGFVKTKTTPLFKKNLFFFD